MSRPVLTAASTEQVDRLADVLIASHAFGSVEEALACHHADPWRIQITDNGDVAVLRRWREHVPYLAVETMHCAASRTAGVIAELRALATPRAFSGLVSSPVPLEQAHLWRRGGMRERERIVVLASRAEPDSAAEIPPDLSLRPGTASDADALLAIDRRCFEDFWRYDRPRLSELMTVARVRVAAWNGTPIGYTLSTPVHGGVVLGRAAVDPAFRRRGAGRALVAEVLSSAPDASRVSLSMQAGNDIARTLYRSLGFRDTGQRLAVLVAP